MNVLRRGVEPGAGRRVKADVLPQTRRPFQGILRILLRSALHGDRFLTGRLVIGFLGGCGLDEGARDPRGCQEAE